MKIVKIKGGLGNQMFQYAFAKYLERELHEEIKLDFHQYERLTDDNIRKPRLMKYQISLKKCNTFECGFFLPHRAKSTSLLYKAGVFLEKSINKNYYFTEGLVYQPPELYSSKFYFDGYWQSHKYVESVNDILKKEFVPNYPLNEKTLRKIEEVSNKNSVFIGVRKGDYIKNKSMRAAWGSFDESYYLPCMDYIARKVDNPYFIIFSNDVLWCKQNLDFSKYEYEYRETADIIDDFEELQIMAACKHAIIVNSTFNWWGAWLHDNPKKIVCCPKNWFFNGQKTEILPERWARF